MALPSHAEDAQSWIQRGHEAEASGDYAAQIESWSRAAELLEAAGETSESRSLLLRRADAYGASGHRRRAIAELERMLAVEEARADPARAAAVRSRLGSAYLAEGQVDEAQAHLRAAVQQARRLTDERLLASTLNNLGNLLTDIKQFEAANQVYAESADLARRAGDRVLLVKVLVNAARASQRAGDERALERSAAAALAESEAVEDGHEKAYALLSIARVLQSSARSGAAQAEMTHRALERARSLAQSLGDTRSHSYALGYLGALYEQQQRNEEALRLTSKALFLGQQLAAPELLYVWHWQSARLRKAMGELDAAIVEYRQALDALRKIRDELTRTYRGQGSAFREVVGPIYLELASLLLQRSPNVADPERRAAYLVEAREAVEQLKTAELQDYFLDPCVAYAEARSTGVDAVAENTAVLYPILLPSRTELLLSLPNGRIVQETNHDVGAAMVNKTVREFRALLTQRHLNKYLGPAKTLYDWLVRPLEATLRNGAIGTLVVVPDGSLRTIPMAALHDGEEFLVKKFALATTPGLNLTDAKPLERQAPRMLLGGVTDPVLGHVELPQVKAELAAIQEVIGADNVTLLENKKFVLSGVERELTGRSYDIVHIASHGKFESDVRKSYLLTYKEKMTMDQLEKFMQLRRFSEEPVELLTLSACQTAAGDDDRAALGLSGIAIKSGSRSALGSLWSVSDEASAELVTEFYRQLTDPDNSKASALRAAQLKLIKDSFFEHPFFWSPFLLIGNWL